MPKLDTSLNIENIQYHQQSGAPTTPAANYWRLYFKSDGLYHKDSAGNEVQLGNAASAVILAPASSTRNVVQPTGDFKALVVKANASQTVNLQEWQTSGGTVKTSIGPGGRVTIPAISGTDANGLRIADASNQLANLQSIDLAGTTYLFFSNNRVYTGAAWDATGFLGSRAASSMQLENGAFAVYTFEASSNDNFQNFVIQRAATLLSGQDSATTTVTDVLTVTHNSTGTPGTGFGTGLLFRGETSTTPDTDIGRIYFDWVTATHASRIGRGLLTARDSTGERTGITWQATGGSVLVQIFGTFFIQGGAAYVVSSAGVARFIEYRTSATTRWRAGANATAEGGSNAGSDYYIEAYNDAGSLLASPVVITRATGVTTLTANDAATSTVTNELVVAHNTSGTPAASYGTGILVKGESSTTADQDMGRLRWLWTTATHASRAADGVLSANDSTGERDVIRWGANGSAATLGFYGATPVTRQTYGAPTGTATRTTFDTGTVTLSQLAERVRAIIDDMRSVGLFA